MTQQKNTFTTAAAMAKACQEAQKHIKKGEDVRNVYPLEGTGRASGCGYDKLSAAICYATNNSNTKNIIIAELIRSHIKSGEPFPYGIYKSNKIYLHFDGCGVSTLLNILKYCGLTHQDHHETKTSDYINCYK